MSKFTRKALSISLSVVTAVSMIGPVAANAQSASDLQAQIAALLAQIQMLQSQLGSSQSAAPAVSSFTRDLTVGSKGDDVSALQGVLISGGYLKISAPTAYFGPATKAALAAWQKATGLTPAVGYFGPKSRAALASVGGGSGTVTPGVVPSTAYLKVESAGSNSGSIPSATVYNKVLTLKLMAGSQEEKVTSITVSRGGYVANARITGVSIWDDMNNRYGNIISSLTADGKATISFVSTPFVVGAGMTKYMHVSINVDSSATSGTLNFSVEKAADVKTVSGSSINGTFPVWGGTFSLVDSANSVGNVYVDDGSVAGITYSTISAASGNVDIGDLDKEVFRLKLTQNNSLEAVKVEKVVLYVEGSFQEARDVKNWKLYSPENNVIATAATPVDRYVTFNLATPYLIDKGMVKEFSVHADIADGSNNYFRVYVMNDYDVSVRGVTTGAAVLAKDSAGASLLADDTQNASGGFRMRQGALTVSKSSASPSGSVAPSSQNVVLGSFDLKASGEQLEVRKIGVQVGYLAAGLALTGTIAIKDATTGESYLSISADTANLQSTGTINAASLLTYQQNLSTYITIPSGTTKTIQVTGTVSPSATSTASYTAHVGQFYAKRFSTNDYATLAASDNSANAIAVTDVSLSVVKNASFPATRRSKGSANVKIGEFVLQSSQADDIRVNTISFDVASSSYIQNMKLMDGATQLGTTIGTPASSGNSYSANVVVAKSTTKVLSVFADVLSSADANNTFYVSVANSGVSGYGVASGKSLSSTPNGAQSGQTITVASPALTISRDSDAPISKIVTAGQTGVELDRIKFEATGEDIALKKMTLQLTSASSVVWTVASLASNLSKVYLYDGSTLLGSADVGDGTTLIFSGMNVTLPQDGNKVLTVKADVTGSGALVSKAVGGIQVKSTSTTDMDLTALASGQSVTTGVTLTSNAASNYFLFHDAAPTIANVFGATRTGVSQTGEIVAKYKITNIGSRTMTITTTTLTVSLGGSYAASSTVNGWKLYDESDTLLSSVVGFVSGTSTSATFNFGSFASQQDISAGSSKTYVVKADTSSIRTGVGSTGGVVNLSTKLDGTKGYSATIGSAEQYWNDGSVYYTYTPVNGSPLVGNLASDSVPVDGTTSSF